MPELNALRYDIMQTEQHLREIEQIHGKASEKYRAEQQKLLRLWALMKMTHKKDEFLNETLAESACPG